MNKIKIPDFPFMGYEEVLTIDDILQQLKPKQCLEWGAGASSFYFPEKHKDYIEDWDSIEHDKKWYKALSDDEKRFPSNLTLFCNSMPEYIYKVENKYDFILIDGIERVKCMKHIVDSNLLNKNGVVVLHDSGRLRYAPGFKYFKYYKILRDGVGVVVDGGKDFAGLAIFSNNPIKYE